MGDASFAQQGIWFTEQALDAGSCYDIPLSISFEGPLDVEALHKACDDVFTRHPLLGCAFEERDGVLHYVESADRPLARFTFHALGPSSFRLDFTAHHLVFDGESKDVLVRDLAALYNGHAGALPPPYSAHVAAEAKRVAAALPAAQRFWAGRRLPAGVTLPGLYNAEQTPYGGEAVHTRLSLPQNLGVSTFEALLGALHCLLWRYGNEEPVVAIDLSTRTPAHRHAIGAFVNELPVIVRVDPGMTFREFVRTLHSDLRELYEHWEVPLGRAVPGLKPATSLAPVSMSYRKRSGADPSFADVDSTVDWMVFNSSARNALHVQIVDSPSGVTAGFQYSKHMIERSSVEAVARHFAALLEGDPDRPVGELPLLSSAEREKLLVGWNATEADFPDDTTLHALIEAQVARTPGATAVTFGDESLSYAELNARANQLAHRLRDLGAGPETIVAIRAERSLDLPVGLLGILKSGAAYLPLDPSYPPARLEFMLSDAAPVAVLTQNELTALKSASTSAQNPIPAAGPDNAAYVVYTSGSTGRPKGVVNTHRGICNRLHWMQKAYRLTPDDVVLQKTPMSFDVSVWEFFWPLLTGASLTLARPDGHKDAGYLRDLIVERGITTVHFVPSMLAAFLAEDGIEKCDSLRTVICSGEELPADVARRLTGRLDVALHNLYGPTEAAIDVSHWHCRPDLLDSLTRVPIGRPIDNIQLYVLDSAMQLVPPGVTGELHIGGVGLARGYLGRPELTAQRFVPNPFGPPGSRLYKTGDLARHLPDGTLEFLGRIDNQIKLRGYRIELGEIEALLRTHATEAVVIHRDDRLVAYLVGARLSVEDLRSTLKRTLPDYMVPSAYVTLDVLPVTPNGKLDRAALPEPETPRESRGEAPRTEAEKLLAALFAEVLGVDEIGIDDDFFDLGGHSLLATKLVSRLRRQLPPDAPRVTVMDLFTQPTVRQLATLIEAEPFDEPKRLWELTKPGPRRMSRRMSLVCVPYGGGNAVVYQPLADALPPDVSLFAVALPGHDPGVVEASLPLHEVAEEVVAEVLRRVDGPLVLYGHCVGSALTIEIARRLEAAGRKVDAVYIGGSFPYALPRRGALGSLARLARLERLRSDRIWANWLRSMGADLSGLPPDEVLTIVRTMRDDAQTGEDYFTDLLETGAPPLQAPIISVVGEWDPITEYYQERYREWHLVTGTTALVVLDEGGHYFLKYRQHELAEIVTRTYVAIADGTATVPVSRQSSAQAGPKPGLGGFLAVATGQMLSITGSALTEFAVPLWIYLQTGSLKWYALAWIVGMAGLLIAPVAGAIVDRCDRRRVMLAADFAAGVTQVACLALYLSGRLTITHIWIVLGCLSIALTFQRLSYASAVPQLVPKHFLGHANGIVQMSTGVAQFVVPLIAAATLAVFDLGGILVFDVVSFVIAVVIVALVRFPATMPYTRRESLGREIVNGWRYSMGNSYFRGMLGYMGLLNVFLSALILLIFPLVLSFADLSTLGMISFVGGAGAALGGLTMALWGGPKRRRMRGMLVSGVLIGAFGMVAGLRPDEVVVALGLAGMFYWLALVNGIYATIVQVKAPQRYHGRVFALNQMIAWSTIPLGLMLIAPIATQWFEPLLAPGGALAGNIGSIIGVGEGRGIGLGYLVFGLIIMALTGAAIRTRVLSRFDTNVPDALPDDVVGLQTLQSRTTTAPRRRLDLSNIDILSFLDNIDIRVQGAVMADV